MKHYLYYVIMGLARFNLYVQSWLLVLDPTKIVMWRLPEICGLLMFITWMVKLLQVISSLPPSLYHIDFPLSLSLSLPS